MSYTLPDHVSIGNKLNFFAWLRGLMNNDLGVLAHISGAPVSGTSGSFAGKAGPGCILIDTTNKNLYMNTNSKASPTWTLLGNATNFSGDVTVSNTGVATIGAGKVTSAKVDPSLIQTVTLPLTNAQIKALRATPITVVAAPGVGFMILPISASVEMVYGGTNAFTSAANDVLGLKWKDGTTASLLTGAVQALVQATASAFGLFVPAVAAGASVNVAKTNVDNQPLVVHNITASEIAGNAGADNTMNLVVKYSVQPTL